nr:hypothetical protein [Tanacetum cinerariifolium]
VLRIDGKHLKSLKFTLMIHLSSLLSYIKRESGFKNGCGMSRNFVSISGRIIVRQTIIQVGKLVKEIHS